SRRRANRMSEVIVCERMWPPCQRWIPFRDATHLFGMRTRTATRREAKERKGLPTPGALAPRVHEGRNAPVSRIGQQCGLRRSCGRLSLAMRHRRVNSRRPLEEISPALSRIADKCEGCMARTRRMEQIESLLAEDPDDAFLRYGLAMEHASAGDD